MYKRNLFFLILISLPLLAHCVLTVSNIKFEGNTKFSDQQLMKKVLLHIGEEFSQKKANETSEMLMHYYKDNGILDVYVYYPELSIENEAAIVTYRIREGNKRKITELTFHGNKYFSSFKLKEFLNIKESDVLELSDLPFILKEITNMYMNRGYLFADTYLSEVIKKEDHLEAVIVIEEGAECRISKLIFHGNKTSKAKSLEKISQINSIRKFNPNTLRKIENNLISRKYIKTCKAVPINSETLLLQIEEGKMTYFSGLMGYDESDDNKKTITGYATLNLYNLFGSDRSLEINWEKYNKYSSMIEAKYFDPLPFKFPLSAETGLYREITDSTLIHTEARLKLKYSTLYSAIGFQFELEDYIPGTRRPKIYEKKSIKSYGISWDHNSLNNNMNPSAGHDLTTLYSFKFFRKDGSLKNYQTTEFSVWQFFKIRKRLVLGISLNGKNIDRKDLEDFELFELGGNNNLRGYREKSMHGYRIGWSNIELRQLISGNSRIFVFTDLGYLESVINDRETTLSNLKSVGFGMRFDTNVGLLRLDYAIGYLDDKWTEISNGFIHFGIETSF